MANSLIKLLLSSMLYYSGGLKLAKQFQKPGILFLVYHRILPIGEKMASHCQPMITSKEIFEIQVAFLKQNYNILSFMDAINILEKKNPIPSMSVVITFDDGYIDNYIYAYPILKKYDIPATIFITTGCIDTGKYLWWDELAYCIEHINREELDTNIINESAYLDDIKTSPFQFIRRNLSRQEITDRLIRLLNHCSTAERMAIVNSLQSKLENDTHQRPSIMLNWHQICEMAQSGITIGCHTLTHPSLHDIPDYWAYKEIAESKKRIEYQLGQEILAFSYPTGKFNSRIKSIVKKCGFKAAVTAESGLNDYTTDLFGLKRKDAGYLTVDNWHYKPYLLAEIAGIFDMIRDKLELSASD